MTVSSQQDERTEERSNGRAAGRSFGQGMPIPEEGQGLGMPGRVVERSFCFFCDVVQVQVMHFTSNAWEPRVLRPQKCHVPKPRRKLKSKSSRIFTWLGEFVKVLKDYHLQLEYPKSPASL